ncbi:MAG TPA: LOG family protein [Rhodanobacter sp.]|nr:LOG family protein [Rhodanobacter sp.]
MRQAIEDSPSYRQAFEGLDFVDGANNQPLRLQLELLKPEWHLQQHHVQSTVVVFGSARLLPPEQAQAMFESARKRARMQPADADLAQELAQAHQRLCYARYYDEARRFAAIVSQRFQRERRRDFVVATGGGPGIMEAANRGAFEVGARSIGLNITLPREQSPNPYVSPELCFRFHYFAMRKMHFLLRAKALVAFPGGFGTLDELFDVLALVQTDKVPRIPIILFGETFWRRAVNFDFLVETGMISAADAALVKVVDSAEQAVVVLRNFYDGMPPA